MKFLLFALLISCVFSEEVTFPVGTREAVFGKRGWYRFDSELLKKQIQSHLEKEGKRSEDIRAIFVPHAGYDYCLPVSVAAYSQLKPETIKRVIVLAPSHYQALEQGVFPGANAVETPFGVLPVDREAITKLVVQYPHYFTVNEQVSRNEHSLELQYPLIHYFLGKVSLVPVVLPSLSLEMAEKYADSLAKVLKEDDLVIVSTDLSHYPTRANAEIVDKESMRSWKTMNPERIYQVEKKWRGSEFASCAMCGIDAILTGVNLIHKLWESPELKLLKHGDSSMAGGNENRVVGYGAAAVYAKGKKGDQMEQSRFNQEERQVLLSIARETIHAVISGKEKIIKEPGSSKLHETGYGVFVTMKNKGMLRGCIGCFSSEKPLWRLVAEYAVASTKDQRFQYDPVTEAELPMLDVEVSVLSPLQKISDWKDVELGKHGIVIEKGWHRGVFLPQVAEETGWNLEDFWMHLCRDKAGLAPDAYKSDPDAELFIFDAEVF
jgi:AmmeMemoRadiSam system protein B/AmmeMemoRadiSam system protein A